MKLGRLLRRGVVWTVSRRRIGICLEEKGRHTGTRCAQTGLKGPGMSLNLSSVWLKLELPKGRDGAGGRGGGGCHCVLCWEKELHC